MRVLKWIGIAVGCCVSAVLAIMALFWFSDWVKGHPEEWRWTALSGLLAWLGYLLQQVVTKLEAIRTILFDAHGRDR